MWRLTRSNSTEGVPENDLKKNSKEKKKIDVIHKTGGLKTIKNYLIDYTENSNLHGLKYIGEKTRSPVERIFWLFMFICCVIICAFLIRKVWIKWNESPVIVSFAENSTPIWQIPYPAVTICFETKAMQTRFNYTKYYHLYFNQETFANLTEEEKHTFEDASLVCDDQHIPKNGRKTSDGNATVEIIRSLSPKMTDVLGQCTWKDNRASDCLDIFSPILTEEGLCYTFNMMNADELFRVENLHSDYQYLEHLNATESWSLEAGYSPLTPLETYPRRGPGYGAKAGLVMFLKAKENELDYICKGPVQGFKILLHNPAELPRPSQQYFRLPLSQELIIAVKPRMMTTTDGLRPYDPERRQCYFPSERYLIYFKVYTQTNCEMECLTNFTYVRCGCVQFGMPHGANMSICNAGSMECVRKAQMELVTIEIQTGIETKAEDTSLGEARNVAARCRCLPACTSIEYEAETSQAEYDLKALYNAFNYVGETERYRYSRVKIYFKEGQFIPSRRSELYGQTDFLANCGGLLGLFMGFSFLSIAEIIYFITLRLCCSLRRRNRRILTILPV